MKCKKENGAAGCHRHVRFDILHHYYSRKGSSPAMAGDWQCRTAVLLRAALRRKREVKPF